jgi:hypothetical protein
VPRCSRDRAVAARLPGEPHRKDRLCQLELCPVHESGDARGRRGRRRLEAAGIRDRQSGAAGAGGVRAKPLEGGLATPGGARPRAAADRLHGKALRSHERARLLAAGSRAATGLSLRAHRRAAARHRRAPRTPARRGPVERSADRNAERPERGALLPEVRRRSGQLLLDGRPPLRLSTAARQVGGVHGERQRDRRSRLSGGARASERREFVPGRAAQHGCLRSHPERGRREQREREGSWRAGSARYRRTNERSGGSGACPVLFGRAR